ncbi:bifunctional DNA primase/polymerase [Kitasatospora sp. NPDC048540]|uniref:bifunctional DNA primase/polymerase n=1 Tax=Kitasatospora sp. NPDC048540 TaxID=3155634 RepID=UPI0033FF595B
MAALDWHDAAHYDRASALPCRHCGSPTLLRDDQRRPAHKVCAETSTTPTAAVAAPVPAGTGTAFLPTAQESPMDWQRALSAAHHAAERGLAVFPLARTKRPAIPSPHPKGTPCRGECGRFGHGVLDATTDHQVIDAMFGRASWATAYGIACGRAPHHLIGLDLDVKDGQDGIADLTALAEQHHFTMPATATVATPSGGLHHWLVAPPGARIVNSVKAVAPGIDVRGVAGYLVGPGSLGERGRYLFAPGTNPDTIAPAPDGLLALLTPKPTPAVLPDPDRLRQGIRKQGAYAKAVIEREAAKVAATKQPGRGRQLFASSAALGVHVAAGTVTEDVAFDALLSAGLSTGLPHPECERTIRRGFAKAAGTLRPAA